MCGIAGLVTDGTGTTRPSVLADAMAETIAHRGPDDCGTWESPDGTVALTHRRLAIVDLSPLGRNPMERQGRYWITFNGEIYNYRELRAELERAGHQFRSQTDTEVILAAYQEWGRESVQRFAGMFAFALWDNLERRLWLARDRVGKKPLYYAQREGLFTFASELKALVADPALATDIDQAALGLYLRYGYVPAPLTIYASARKLPPGHDAVYENGRLQIRQYWNPLTFVGQGAGMSEDEAAAALEQLLGTAVRQRRIADVPLGAFLSGGVDSSLIVALMQEQADTPVKTFTIRFENQEYNEADYAAAVARHLRTEHFEETCTAQQMLEVVDRVPTMYDEPFADSSAIPTYLVSKIARSQVTVALSGDGGDELFFGYPRYVHYADSGWVLSLPAPVRKTAAGIAARLPTRRLRRIGDVLRDDDADRYGRFVNWWSRTQVETLTRHPLAQAPIYAGALAAMRGVPVAEQPPLLDLVSYLPDDILAKVDRASMAVALEVRAPLLDHRVVEFAVGLPPHLKRRNGATKWLLRRLLYKRVPANLIERPKMGFGVPLGDWFRGPLRDRMMEFCKGDDLAELGLDPAPVRTLWSQFLAGSAHRPDLLWQMYVLIAWSRATRTARAPLAHAGGR